MIPSLEKLTKVLQFTFFNYQQKDSISEDSALPYLENLISVINSWKSLTYLHVVIGKLEVSYDLTREIHEQNGSEKLLGVVEVKFWGYLGSS